MRSTQSYIYKSVLYYTGQAESPCVHFPGRPKTFFKKSSERRRERAHNPQNPVRIHTKKSGFRSLCECIYTTFITFLNTLLLSFSPSSFVYHTPGQGASLRKTVGSAECRRSTATLCCSGGRFEWLRNSGCDTKTTEGPSTGSGISGRAAGCSQCTRTGGDAPRQLGWGSSAGTATATAQPSSAPTGTAPICHCASSSPSSPSPRAPREGRLCCASEAACAWAARVTRGAAVSSLCEGPLPLLSAEAVAKRRDLRICVVREQTAEMVAAATVVAGRGARARKRTGGGWEAGGRRAGGGWRWHRCAPPRPRCSRRGHRPK